MDLTTRQQIILKTIVERFTMLAEPIGSKSLKDHLDFQVSSATIRNEMACREKEGLLEKTHISSGRIPSQQGYRYYVEHLMELNVDPKTEEVLKELFTRRHFTLEEIIETSCSILSDMTNLTSVVLGPDSQTQKLIRVELIPVTLKQAVAVIVTDAAHTEHRVFSFEAEVSTQDLKVCTDLFNEELKGTPLNRIVERMKEIEPEMASRLARHEILFEAFISAFIRMANQNAAVYGRANMLCQPDFTDIKKVEQLMRVMEDPSLFKAWAASSASIDIPIDTRNRLIQIGDCSVVSTSFKYSDEEVGQLMVVGPSRMNYSRVISLMDTISDVIEDTVNVHSEGCCNKKNE